MASKGLGRLPRRKGSELAHGCGRGGRVVLPLPRAAAVWTGLRLRRSPAAVGARHGEVAARPLAHEGVVPPPRPALGHVLRMLQPAHLGWGG